MVLALVLAQPGDDAMRDAAAVDDQPDLLIRHASHVIDPRRVPHLESHLLPLTLCRPSGTEPKLKNYVEVVVPVGDSVGVARSEADRLITGIKTDLSAALGLG